VVRRLAGGLDIRLNTDVQAVRWSRSEVRLGARGAVPLVEARRVVVAIPLGALPQLQFVPEPPALTQLAFLEMGPAVRLVMRFHEPFWEDRYPRLSFIHSLEHPIPTWWTMLPLRAPMLTGWAAGPAADRFQGRGDEAILQAALETLRAFFGDAPARHLAGWHRHDWQAVRPRSVQLREGGRHCGGRAPGRAGRRHTLLRRRAHRYRRPLGNRPRSAGQRRAGGAAGAFAIEDRPALYIKGAEMRLAVRQMDERDRETILSWGAAQAFYNRERGICENRNTRLLHPPAERRRGARGCCR
jgi:hypothetical protein